MLQNYLNYSLCHKRHQIDTSSFSCTIGLIMPLNDLHVVVFSLFKQHGCMPCFQEFYVIYITTEQHALKQFETQGAILKSTI